MSDSDDDPLFPFGCRTLVVEGDVRVAILHEVVEAYDALRDPVRDKLQRIMFRWCGGHAMTAEMFNGNEGRSQKGLALKAFKTFKHRMYGFETNIAGMRTFVIVDHDPAKKRDKADQKILARAKGRIDAFGKGK